MRIIVMVTLVILIGCKQPEKIQPRKPLSEIVNPTAFDLLDEAKAVAETIKDKNPEDYEDWSLLYCRVNIETVHNIEGTCTAADKKDTPVCRVQLPEHKKKAAGNCLDTFDFASKIADPCQAQKVRVKALVSLSGEDARLAFDKFKSLPFVPCYNHDEIRADD